MNEEKKNESGKTIGQKLDMVVEEAKDNAEKAGEFIANAAKEASGFAGEQIENAKKVFGRISQNLESNRSRQRLEKYKPVFEDKLISGQITFPNMINVVSYDKRMDIEECKGAIGYQENINKVDLLGIYKNDIDKFNLTFYPEKAEGVYYVHPFKPNEYIEIFEYFKCLKEERVAELEYIAQALGAKHFKVAIVEESLSEQSKDINTGVKFGLHKNKAGVGIKKTSEEKQYEFVGITAENYFPGKDPVRPELKYWANNISIKNLVEQRLDKDNPLMSKTFKLDYNTSSGIKEKEAAKIDGVMKSLKFGAEGSISEAARNESKKRLEYTIEF